MWPTFYVSGLVRGTVDRDCFYLYTKTADEERMASDGRSIDADMRFPTVANTAYWVVGRIKAKLVDATGDPGVRFTVLHTGVTKALASRSQIAASFAASSNTTYGSELQPEALQLLGSYTWAKASPVTNHEILFLPEFTIVAGASGGECGIGWGLSNLSANLGRVSLLAGSFIYVRRLG